MPNYVEIPDLLFKGAKVYVQQEDNASAPTSSVPPSTSNPPPAPALSYPVSILTHYDKFYLYRMVMPYKSALRMVPGSHQVHFDVLTDNYGRLFSDGVPQPTGTVNDPLLKTKINQAINYAGMTYAAECASWDVNSYSGPLKAIVQNVINLKLGK